MLYKSILVFIVLILVNGCRTYHFKLSDPQTNKEIEFKMQHNLSDTALGRASFKKDQSGEWVVEIENLQMEQKLADIIDKLASIAAANAANAMTPVP